MPTDLQAIADPRLILLAWAAGFEFAYEAMVRAGGIAALRASIGTYAVLIAAIFVVVTGWSLTNRLRFSRRNRRGAPPPATDETLARDFDVTLDTLNALRVARSLRLSIDEAGHLQINRTMPDSPRRDGAFSAPDRSVPA